MDKNTFFAGLVIVVIGCLIGFNFIYLPKMEELRLLEEMQKQEEEKVFLSDEIADLGKKVAEYEKNLFPPGREEIELLNCVREIASESGVRVTSMRPREEGRGGRTGKMERQKFSLTISFEGMYHQLGDFVAKVENAEKAMKIDMLEFSVVQREDLFPLHCQLTLSVFSVP